MKQNVQILFRSDLATEEEILIAKEYFDVVEFRSEGRDSLVFGRYSTLPYYKELEQDLTNQNSQLINSYKQYNWIANFEWYEALEPYTFKTWFNGHELKEEDAPFVVKGKTNSRKQYWDTLMYAETKKRAIEIAWELSKDALISTQGLVFRKFEKLITYETGINGLPFTKEFRFFFYKGKVLAYSYYWGIAENTEVTLSDDGYKFAETVGKIIADYVNFYVLDIAQKETGEWVLVEINDGQMSGLSEIDPHVLYSNLKKCLDEEYTILLEGLTKDIIKEFSKYCVSIFIDTERNDGHIWYLFGLNDNVDNVDIRSLIRDYLDENPIDGLSLRSRFVLNTFTEKTFISAKKIY